LFLHFFILQQEQEQNSTIYDPTLADHTTTNPRGKRLGRQVWYKTAIRKWLEPE